MTTPNSILRNFRQHLADALLWLMAATLLLWFGDWAVWRVRVWQGGGYDTVEVNHILLTPLKNHRMKADEQSTAAQPCARSLFPHGGNDPCWWLRRHATEWQSASLTKPGASAWMANPHRVFATSSLTRVWSVIQFTSQVFPQSSEKACSKCAELGVMPDQL
jgi:hypothetical protein